MTTSKFCTRISLLGALFAAAAAHAGLQLPADLDLRAPFTPAQGVGVRYRVRIPNRTPLEGLRFSSWLINNHFDIAGVDLQHGEIELITHESGVAALTRAGFQGRVMARHAPGLEDLPDPRFLNPDTLSKRLQAIAQRYPQFTRLQQVGASLEGRPILAVLVSNTPAANDPAALAKPSILVDGMHHAREVMSPEIVVDIIETMLSGLEARNPRLTQLVGGFNLWFIPMLNVDGNNIVWTRDNWWRKNARSEGGSVFGVDLNRNYPYRFGECNASSGDRSSETYRGAGPASEPETQALLHLAEELHPIAAISYHSFGELVIYPYGCEGESTSENHTLDMMAKEIASALPSDASPSAHYTPGTSWAVLYPVDGDSKSHLFAAYGSIAYTIEVNREFQPSYDLRAPTVAKHRIAWQKFLDRLDRNLLELKVVDARKNGPAPGAVISVNTISHTHGEKPFVTNVAGNYFKVLEAGRYTINARLPDGRTGQIDVQMSGQQRQQALLTIR